MEMVSSYCQLEHLVCSMLCFFGKLSSGVTFRWLLLFVLCFNFSMSVLKYYSIKVYCTSFYGCELWNLSYVQLAELCTKLWTSVLIWVGFQKIVIPKANRVNLRHTSFLGLLKGAHYENTSFWIPAGTNVTALSPLTELLTYLS